MRRILPRLLFKIGLASCTLLLLVPNYTASAETTSGSLLNAFGLSETTQFSDGPIQVEVTAAGTTPQSNVVAVEAVLVRYNIARNDGENVHMGSKGMIYIDLAKTAGDYHIALKTIGLSASEAASLSSDTAGFTMGDTVIVPMYENHSTADLVNTLAHEMTHALFNENVGPLPSWINEGLAVSDGMYAQARAEAAKAYLTYAKHMESSVLNAIDNGELIPLADDESSVYNSTYDVELQDWLSVQYLMKRFGYASILSYFTRLKLGENYDAAFRHTFGMSSAQFNHEFTEVLRQSASTRSPTLQLAVVYPMSFAGGEIQINQHNQHVR